MEHSELEASNKYKEMCDSCSHKWHCMGVYRKNHWCGNHTKRNLLRRVNTYEGNNSMATMGATFSRGKEA